MPKSSRTRAGRERHPRIERRIALLRSQHHDRCADLHPREQVDDVLVGEADAAGRNRLADIFGLIRAVHAEQRVLVALVEVKGARPHRVMRAGRNVIRNVAEPLLDVGGGDPAGPLFHAADLGDARPRQRFFADRHAIADRLAFRQHVIEVARIGIDDESAGPFLAVVADDMAPVRLRDRRLGIGRIGKHLLVARLEARLRRRLQGRLNTSREHQTRKENCYSSCWHGSLLFHGKRPARPGRDSIRPKLCCHSTNFVMAMPSLWQTVARMPHRREANVGKPPLGQCRIAVYRAPSGAPTE